MPPKKKNTNSVPKNEPKKVSPEKDEAPKGRTRGKPAARSESEDLKASKKVKKDESSAIKDTTTKEPVKEAVKEQMKKVVMKGKAPVDQYLDGNSNYQVYEEKGEVFSATLNQSNVSANNNKFYILQVLVDINNKNKVCFFTRWGRVGVPGQQAPMFTDNTQMAIGWYRKKKREKINGGYREVQMNYDADDEGEKQEKKEHAKKKNEDEPQVVSNLPQRVQDLIKLIFDMKMMNNQMKEIGYDAKKMPLGKLAKASILKGYQALKGLMEEVKGKKRRDVYNRLSSDFYSDIPHDFGFQNMQNFILDSQQKIKKKLEMLQSLEDIQVFTKLLDQGGISNVNELDSNYLKLGTTITPLDKESDMYKLLVQYVENTHASTHTAYKLEVLDIFQCSKDSENSRYKKEIDNKQLLWHGSRLTNFVGILSQGLRIAPPEAPVTGYMFGKGVYFADMVTKSANYCFTNPMNNTGLMLLCEVALGGMNQKFFADYYANLLPQGKHSTKGVGKTAPGSGQFIDDGKVYVPSGKGVSTNIANSSLLYNQFIVYDVAQIKSRYLFRMKFNYGSNRGW